MTPVQSAKRNLPELDIDWTYEAVTARRERYLSPALRTFIAYEKPLLIQRGEMQYLYDQRGKRYLDCLAQNLTISVGHRHPRVMAEVSRQMEDLLHCTTMYLNPVPGHAAEELVARLPAGQDWVVHYVNSGAEAIDLALLMARVYTRNFDIIALRNSFHGLHFSAMAVTGMAACRQPIPSAPGVLHTDNPDQYRGLHGPSASQYIRALESLLETSGNGSVAGILIEPIQGYGGVIPVAPGYMAAAFERIRAAGGICIVDEVQTGFARMGSHYWGFEMHGVMPDMIVMGKGISNGLPLSAVATRREIAEAMTKRRFFNTYGANPVACAASRAVLKIIDDDQLQENARKVGQRMMEGLLRLKEKHDLIGDVRGHGLMIGVELVRDHATKEPATEETGRVFEKTKELGLIMGRSGPHKNVLRISPPLCIQLADIDEFDRAMNECLLQA
jgi:alanine-glyoxylate transaminase / (R)-3-amino-2-methylpropionate-pyruvate transaminase